jgi:hypothetical protein
MEQREFSVSVSVKASQDEIPEGVQFLLDTLVESSFSSESTDV